MTTTTYYEGLNQRLLNAVPLSARRILEVGCGSGRLADALKQQQPARFVCGVELNPAAAAIAAFRLDRVWCGDVAEVLQTMDEGHFDCVVFGDVLEHLPDPAEVLRLARRVLNQDGYVLACIPNVQHYSVLSALLSNNFQYHDAGLLDHSHIRLFGLSGIQKCFLDAGYLCHLFDTIKVPAPESFTNALLPALTQLRTNASRMLELISAYQFIVIAERFDLPDFEVQPMSVVACVNDLNQYENNLAASECLRGASPHEIIPVTDASSVAQGLATGMARARHDWVVLAHQDIYLPKYWPNMMQSGWHAATATFGKVGVAGVFGLTDSGDGKRRCGRVIDRFSTLDEPPVLPARGSSLDEIVLTFKRDMIPVVDSAFGFHMYGSEACCESARRGFASVVVDAPCLHNSAGDYSLPPAFFDSARHFVTRYPDYLPYISPCATIHDADNIELLSG